jgi:hypothetical protein
MRKDDIISQKLFETCKLSEFYLNLVVNSKYEEESPLQLAKSYTDKLYEIVERYDRLLDSSRQREQLTLSFDNNLNSNLNGVGATATAIASVNSTNPNSNLKGTVNSKRTTTPLHPLSASSSLTTTSTGANGFARAATVTSTNTSTPYKYVQALGSQSPFMSAPINSSTQNSTLSTPINSYASTPTTPFRNAGSYIKASFSNYSLNSQRSATTAATSARVNRHLANSTSSSSTRLSANGNTPLLPKATSHSNQNNKLYQRIMSIYYSNDDDDDVDKEACDNRNENGNEADEINDEELIGDDEDGDEENEYFDDNESCTTANYASACVGARASADYRNLEVHLDENFSSNNSCGSGVIEKSYSNLSKDSGIFADSYHSDYSNYLIAAGSSNASTTAASNDNKNDSLLSESDALSNTEASIEKTETNICNKEDKINSNNFVNNINDEAVSSNSSKRDTNRSSFGSVCEKVNSLTWSKIQHKRQDNNIIEPLIKNPAVSINDHKQVPIESTTPLKLLASLSKVNKDANSCLISPNGRCMTTYNSNGYKYKTYKLSGDNNNAYVEASALPSRLDINKYKNLLNVNLNDNYGDSCYDSENMISLLVDHDSSQPIISKQNHNNLVMKSNQSIKTEYNNTSLLNDTCQSNPSQNHQQQNEQHSNNQVYSSNSNLSCCSSISTPSPSSTSSSESGSSTTNGSSDIEKIDQDASLLSTSSTATAPNLSSFVKASTPFIFNYNSLMNVSMLDSIQATNTNLDSMNTSILMFN